MLLGPPLPRGPPSEEALRLRPWFGLILLLQFSLCVLHFWVGDIWGGIMVILVSMFGYQVYKYDMDFTWAMCYGLVVAMETVFDLIHLAIRVGQVPEPFFKKYMVLDIILVTAPVLSAIQAWMMHKVYTSCLQQENDALMANQRFFAGGGGGYGTGPVGGAEARAPRQPRGGRVGGGGVDPASGRPYDWNSAGTGHTLGN